MQINIMVEGFEDQELVAVLLTELGKVPGWREQGKSLVGESAAGNPVAIYEMGGWTTIPTSTELLPRLQQSPEVGVQNLIVYDADTPRQAQGGFEVRRAELQRQASELGLSFESFLLPDNGTDGNLEDLMHKMVHPSHQLVADCFSNYEECVRLQRTPAGTEYRLPISKSRYFAYIEALPLTPEEVKHLDKRRGTKLFGNSNYWNLAAPEVQPLRDFLDQNVQ